jgi:hypothetical protein
MKELRHPELGLMVVAEAAHQEVGVVGRQRAVAEVPPH